jgi:hypothetical protein
MNNEQIPKVGYLNFNLNAYDGPPPKEKDVIVDLKKLYKEMRKIVPGIQNNLKIDSLEVCASSQTCHPRKRTGGRSDYLVAVKDKNTNVQTNLAENVSKYVVFVMRGTYNIDGVEENIYLRIPKSGVIGARLGTSKQNRILIKDKQADEKVKTLANQLSKDIFDLTQIKRIRPTKLVGTMASGFSLLRNQCSDNGMSCPNCSFKISNFMTTSKKLLTSLENYGYFWDFVKRETKSIRKVDYKSELDESPTISLFESGKIQILGGKSVNDIRQANKRIMDALQIAEDNGHVVNVTMVKGKKMKIPSSVKKVRK